MVIEIVSLFQIKQKMQYKSIDRLIWIKKTQNRLVNSVFDRTSSHPLSVTEGVGVGGVCDVTLCWSFSPPPPCPGYPQSETCSGCSADWQSDRAARLAAVSCWLSWRDCSDRVGWWAPPVSVDWFQAPVCRSCPAEETGGPGNQGGSRQGGELPAHQTVLHHLVPKIK